MPRPHQTFYQRHEALILGGCSVGVVTALWEWAWRSGWISPLFFSGPSEIAGEFAAMYRENLVSDVICSGKNFALGFSLAAVAGVASGIVVGWYRRVRLILDPFLTALYATPRVAMVPLIILWLGTGYKSTAFVVFLSAFFPILVNSVAGVRALDADLLRAARAYCASDWGIFKTIALPGSVPFILTGLRQGVAIGLIGLVVGEMQGGSDGVGFIIANGSQFKPHRMLVGVLIVAFAGIVLTWLAERLERRFSRWRPESN
jgi:NitT/TauT family transport system permease protein